MESVKVWVRPGLGSVLLIIALVLALGGCSGGGSSQTPTPVDEEEEQPSTEIPAPTGLAAEAKGPYSIELNWDAPADPHGMQIQRSEDAGANFADLLDITSADMPHLDENLDAGQEYVYRARYHRDGFYSPWSSTASAMTELPTAPLAPSGLTVKAFSESQIDLTWVDAADDETAYRVERMKQGGSYTVVNDALPVDSESFMDMGLNWNTTYTYRVYALNDVGDSPASGEASAKTHTGLTLSFTISVPATSTTGSYTVQLSAHGLGSTSAFIEEATNATFTQGVQKWTNSSFSSPWSRSISGKAAGTYYYRGGTGSIVSPYRSITVTKSSTPTSVTLYPTADNQIIYDSFGTQGYSNTVFNTGLLGTGIAYFIGPFVSNSALYGTKMTFNVASLTGKATVSKATLRMYAYYLPGDFTTHYYDVAASAYSWSASTVKGSDSSAWYYKTSGKTSKAYPVSSSVAWDVDVTLIVKNWVGSVYPNYGFLLQGQILSFYPSSSIIRVTSFESSDTYTSVSRRPQLIINYTPK